MDTLSTLFSSRVRAKVLTRFFLSPGIEWNAWELSQSLRESYGAVWKELNRLEEIGILKSARRGRTKGYQVDPQCSIVPELRSMVMKTEGIGSAIREKLSQMDGVREAYIYGSFASGEADERSDVDLMIIGEVQLEELAPLIAQAERELNRPINYSVYTAAEWDERLANQDPFAVNVARSPKIMLIENPHAV